MADLSQAGREALEDLIEWCAGPLGLEQYGAVESDSNGEPITCLLSLGTLRAGMAALRKARAALAAREEPQTCVCNAKCWRVGGEAACLYVSDNSWKAAMAARATVLAAAAREDAERPDEREYRYECAHGHSWIAAPTERMKCCVCGTISLQRLKPIDNHDEMARQLWRWNVEHGGTGYPYGRLIDVTKDDLRTLARRLAPFVQPVRDTEQERER